MSFRNIQQVNENAEMVSRGHALSMNIASAKGLQDVVKSNLGPKGTLKMLVGGSGDIKLTKDGHTLLSEMQIQNPTASMIARTATAQDDITGDGTTACVIFTGELLKQAERFLQEGLHPRIVADGFDLAKARAIDFLDEFKKEVDITDRDLLIDVARTSLRTKVHKELADHLAPDLVDAVKLVSKPDEPVDLHMVEVMHMLHKSDLDTQLVRGLVLDHGARHHDMPTRLENCYILTCNVSLEWERSEVQSGFYYKDADQRQKLVDAERRVTDVQVEKILELKRKVCPEGSGKSFVVLNQKGIDPMALEALSREGILALRRAKRRNMERLTLACGGDALNSFDDLSEDCLGYAGLVYEQTLGDEKYTFVEDVKFPTSCTMLIRGPHNHVIEQIKETVRDGLRAVRNVLDDKCVIPGAGAFEVACAAHLKEYMPEVKGRAKLGVQAFADAMLVIPKTLADNGGHDPQDTVIALQEAHEAGELAGVNLEAGGVLDPMKEGIYDAFMVKRQSLHLTSVIASQFLLTDEILKAGKKMGKGGPSMPGMD
jgi:T-complex protein 1 subunit zeta